MTLAVTKQALALLLAMAMVSLPIAGYAETGNGSADALSEYLHQNRLPLVQAQITESESGDRQVVLYGFVATDLGKQHAEEHARAYLKDPNVEVANRIKVRPELATLGKQPDSSAPRKNAGSSRDSETPGRSETTRNTPNDVQAYTHQNDAFFGRQQSSMSLGTDPLTLLILGAMFAFGSSSSGGMHFGSGFGPSYGVGPSFGSYSSYGNGRPMVDPFATNPDPFFSTADPYSSNTNSANSNNPNP